MMNSHVRIHIYECICSMNSFNTNIFPPLSIKVISMGTTCPPLLLRCRAASAALPTLPQRCQHCRHAVAAPTALPPCGCCPLTLLPRCLPPPSCRRRCHCRRCSATAALALPTPPPCCPPSPHRCCAASAALLMLPPRCHHFHHAADAVAALHDFVLGAKP